jgi:OOP family OmpA-OmpF porin
MKRGLLLLLALAGLAVLAFICIRWHAPLIERDIASRTEQALSSAALGFAAVRVDGRDVHLTGTAPSREALDRAVEVAMAVRGSRWVDSALVLAAAPEPQPAAPPPVVAAPPPAQAPAVPTVFDFSFKPAGNTLTLSGTLPDEATQQKFVQAIRSSRGDAGRIDPQIEFNPAAPETWRVVLGALLRFWDDVIQVTARLEGSNLRIAGEMKSQKSRGQFEQFLKSALPAETAAVYAIDVPVLTPAAATCQKDIDGLLSTAELRFKTASASVDLASSGALLRELAGIAGRCPKVKITIAGHTDSNGSTEFNLKLSRERAQSVARLLTQLGVDGRRITTVGYGETRPVADNGTETGRALNRRIEFVITEE